jgi:hypothetical protein
MVEGIEIKCHAWHDIPSAFDDVKDLPSIAGYRGSSWTPALGM